MSDNSSSLSPTVSSSASVAAVDVGDDSESGSSDDIDESLNGKDKGDGERRRQEEIASRRPLNDQVSKTFEDGLRRDTMSTTQDAKLSSFCESFQINHKDIQQSL